jgi:hypothetical protein
MFKKLTKKIKKQDENKKIVEQTTNSDVSQPLDPVQKPPQTQKPQPSIPEQPEEK